MQQRCASINLDSYSRKSFKLFLHVLYTPSLGKLLRHRQCMVSGDFFSLLQDLIPEAIPSQECHLNMDSLQQFLSCVHLMFIRHVFHVVSHMEI